MALVGIVATIGWYQSGARAEAVAGAQACVDKAMAGKYPKLGHPVNGRLAQPHLLKMSHYNNLQFYNDPGSATIADAT